MQGNKGTEKEGKPCMEGKRKDAICCALATVYAAFHAPSV